MDPTGCPETSVKNYHYTLVTTQNSAVVFYSTICIAVHINQELMSVGIATRYELDGPGIESRWGGDFLHPSRPVLGPTQSPIQWVPGLSREYSGRGVALNTPPSSAEVKERVQLYLYSPYGPSWPVLGWTSTFTVVSRSRNVKFYFKVLSGLSRTFPVLFVTCTLLIDCPGIWLLLLR